MPDTPLTPWIGRVGLLVPEGARAIAAGAAAQLTGHPADNTPDFFSIPCVPTGSTEVTHYAAVSPVREGTLASLDELAQQIPTSGWVVIEHVDDTPEQAAARPSLDAWLAARGFEQVIDEPEDIT